MHMDNSKTGQVLLHVPQGIWKQELGTSELRNGMCPVGRTWQRRGREHTGDQVCSMVRVKAQSPLPDGGAAPQLLYQFLPACPGQRAKPAPGPPAQARSKGTIQLPLPCPSCTISLRHVR